MLFGQSNMFLFSPSRKVISVTLFVSLTRAIQFFQVFSFCSSKFPLDTILGLTRGRACVFRGLRVAPNGFSRETPEENFKSNAGATLISQVNLHCEIPTQTQIQRQTKNKHKHLMGSLMTPLTVTSTFLGPALSLCSHSHTPWGSRSRSRSRSRSICRSRSRSIRRSKSKKVNGRSKNLKRNRCRARNMRKAVKCKEPLRGQEDQEDKEEQEPSGTR